MIELKIQFKATICQWYKGPLEAYSVLRKVTYLPEDLWSLGLFSATRHSNLSLHLAFIQKGGAYRIQRTFSWGAASSTLLPCPALTGRKRMPAAGWCAQSGTGWIACRLGWHTERDRRLDPAILCRGTQWPTGQSRRAKVESGVSISPEGFADGNRHSKPPCVQPEGDCVNSRRLIVEWWSYSSVTIGQRRCHWLLKSVTVCRRTVTSVGQWLSSSQCVSDYESHWRRSPSAISKQETIRSTP